MKTIIIGILENNEYNVNLFNENMIHVQEYRNVCRKLLKEEHKQLRNWINTTKEEFFNIMNSNDKELIKAYWEKMLLANPNISKNQHFKTYALDKIKKRNNIDISMFNLPAGTIQLIDSEEITTFNVGVDKRKMKFGFFDYKVLHKTSTIEGYKNMFFPKYCTCAKSIAFRDSGKDIKFSIMSKNMALLKLPKCEEMNVKINNKRFKELSNKELIIRQVRLVKNNKGNIEVHAVMNEYIFDNQKRQSQYLIQGYGKDGMDLNTSGENGCRTRNTNVKFSHEFNDKYDEIFNEIKLAQKSYQSKKNGSKNYIKSYKKFLQLHAKLTNMKKNETRHFAHRCIKDNNGKILNSLAIENLETANMRGKLKHVNKGLSKIPLGAMIIAIEDIVLRLNEQKFKINIIKVDPYNTTKYHNKCGHINPSRTDKEDYICEKCKKKINRDENAAKNIYDIAFRNLIIPRKNEKSIELPF